MEKFKNINSIPAYLPEINIDTDKIIPKQFLKTIKRTGLGKNLFFEMRYNDKGNPSIIEQVDDTIKVYFGNGVSAITPGQAAVFYEGDDVIGGGWIKSSFDKNSKIENKIINHE